MRGKYYCKRCERTLRLTKCGAVPVHLYHGVRIIKVPRMTPELRKKLEAEIKQWQHDHRYIPITAIGVEISGTQGGYCSDRAYWPAARRS